MLAQRVLAPLSVEVGMLYSAPQLQAALTRLRDGGAQRILALPLFPQYCAATTGAAFDAVSAVLRGWRRLPDVQFVAGYHDHPGYIEALRASVAEHWQAHGRTAHLLMSFHGIPERNVRAGDPYLSQCQNTARLLADELLLREGEWSVSFQSRFGPAGWLKPYTLATLAASAGARHPRGERRVPGVCGGLPRDSRGDRRRESRRLPAAGGKRYEYVPALNVRASHAQCLADLIAQHCQALDDERPRQPVANGAWHVRLMGGRPLPLLGTVSRVQRRGR